MTDPPEPVYRCLTDGNGPFSARYYVVVRRGEIAKLTHYPRHVACSHRAEPSHPSRDGCFQHGYGGSGPADLARSILYDYLGLAPFDYFPHPALYQAFKWEYVAVAPRDRSWRLDGVVIRDWLRCTVGLTVPWIEPTARQRVGLPFRRNPGIRERQIRDFERRVQARFGLVAIGDAPV